MKPKILLIIAFVVVAIAQLLVPYRMISHEAEFANSGNEFIFKVSNSGQRYSIRGNHIWLRFEADKVPIKDKNMWENSQSVFVTFERDSLGMARIADVSKNKPENNDNWIKAKAFLRFESKNIDSLKTRRFVNVRDSSHLYLTYPFQNFNIGDANPKEKEKIFLKTMNNSFSDITLRVKIRQNQFLVGELTADTLSFREYVKEQPGK